MERHPLLTTFLYRQLEQKEEAVVSLRCSDQSLPSIAFLCFVSYFLTHNLAMTFSALTPFVPSPTFQVVSSQPYVGDCRGTAALRLLNVLHYSVHPTLDQLWSKKVPLLVEHIEGRKGLLLGRNSLLESPPNRTACARTLGGVPGIGWGTARMPNDPRYIEAL